ncbi:MULTISPECIES: hypothetical protein [Streptomyces]|uniref:hypothetical protein n=1 Tax=Streptomyces TaxID=1883 RepID=UPI00163BA945|nr:MULTISPECIES: hypothetical protein [Streptomyces]MBC2877449.1 hypothetical protein [Streptomyces sp. TYQ1024]UBI38247.1 hypothetical protein K7I03_18495 [Streptomyces mobaraensis]UKW30833.1 hypothetical protein MCU78_18455 [Streptomyces sp. TYQ1024]
MRTDSEQLAGVVAAAVEVAAESARAGAFTDEVARTLTALVSKIADRAVESAEVNGFVSGWQEAIRVVQTSEQTGAQVYRMPKAED